MPTVTTEQITAAAKGLNHLATIAADMTQLIAPSSREGHLLVAQHNITAIKTVLDILAKPAVPSPPAKSRRRK